MGPMKNRTLFWLPFIIFSLLLCACEDPGKIYEQHGTTVVGNTTPSTQNIDIGKLDPEGKVLIKIPLLVFGFDKEDLEDAHVTIYNNDKIHGIIKSPLNLYNTLKQFVIFTLSALSDGDTLEFIIQKDDESIDRYIGQVFAEESSKASKEEDDNSETPPSAYNSEDVPDDATETPLDEGLADIDDHGSDINEPGDDEESGEEPDIEAPIESAEDEALDGFDPIPFPL